MKTLLGFHPLPQTGVRPRAQRVFLRRPNIPRPRAPRYTPADPGFVPKATAALVIMYAMVISVFLSVVW